MPQLQGRPIRAIEMGPDECNAELVKFDAEVQKLRDIVNKRQADRLSDAATSVATSSE